jgi:hypothetical protein
MPSERLNAATEKAVDTYNRAIYIRRASQPNSLTNKNGCGSV